MRLRNIDLTEAAQAFLPAFMLTWNARFEPRDKAPAHRPWTKTVDELDLALARRKQADTFESTDVQLRRDEILREDQRAWHGDAGREGAGASLRRWPGAGNV